MEQEQKTIWGAYKSEWNKFIELGLVDDMLPVVSNPGAGVSPNSKMKGLGKTPSVYNGEGFVAGVKAWTERTATVKDVAKWSKQADYGICIQTRIVRAFDIDVPDVDKAAAIEQFIYDFLEQRLPLRFRTNSGKKLLAFKMPGDFGKRVLKVEGGMIEFLATGQQFVAAGQHTSGVRYEWDWAGFDNFPELPVGQFEDLWFALSEMFGTEAAVERGIRNKEKAEAVPDETLDYLEEKGLVIDYGIEGQAFIECPFKDEHTTESNDSATAYFPKGSRGYQQGHFVCLHAHCAKRNDNEFLDKLGKFNDEMDTIITTPEEKALELPRFQRDKFGKPEATINNVQMAVGRPDLIGCMPCYDIFRDDIIFYSPDRSKWERASDTHYIQLRIILETQHRFRPIPKEMIRDAVLHVATANKVDTAQEWLSGLVWDGIPRIERFLADYFGADDTEYTRAVSMYLWTGLAGRIIEPGLKCDMVPIAKGIQGSRKSSLIEAIAPSPDEFCEIDFDEKDADLARKMRGILIAEISELRGMKTRAIESIKAFTARRYEKWIPKYREFSVSFPRRLMFIATTNDEQFLADATGNRRWLPFEVMRRASVTKIRRDRAQLWAEAAVMFDLVGLCFEKAERLATKEHERYTVSDPWEDVVNDWLNREEDTDGGKPGDRPYLRASDVFREALNIDPRSIRKGEEMKLSNVLKFLGYRCERIYEQGARIRVWLK